ncbi:MAG: ATP-binding protein, partial [Deltaproteobacteria bacterium]|nr:ATP-binding protein [Deltaproteobacteria bacterium]
EERDRTVKEVQRDALIAARYLATVQETIIGSTRQVLANLAHLPQVQRLDPEGCNAIFSVILKQSPYYDTIGAADPEGWIFACAPAAQGKLNIAHRLYFQKAVQNRAFAVGEPIFCRISNKYTINLAYPIQDDLGRLKGVVFAGVDLDWLGSLSLKSDFPPGTGLILLGAGGQVLFRYPEPLEYIGKMLPDPALQAMAAHVEGVVESREMSDDLRLISFTRLAPPWQELRVAVSLSKKLALEPVNREFRRDLIWLSVVMVLSVVVAWFGANISILHPVNKLLEVTRRLTHGDLEARTGGPYRRGELGQLAQAFDQMADSLQERDADLKKTATELQERVQELDRRSLELAASNKELENFTYSVAHDLRAPLRAIGGFARVLLEDYPDKLNADGQRYLNIIHSDARRMGRLIDDLLALARLGRKEMRFAPLDVFELAQEIFNELQANHPERHLQIEIQPLPPAWGDRAMIRQVLENLLLNAIKFTQDRDTALIQVSGWSEADDHVYCVRDNGIGFDMKYVNKLFGVFQRLHPEKDFEGTGVGLAMVRRIIERHGGRMWAESRVNEGAAFYFTLSPPSCHLTSKTEEAAF